MQRRESAEFKGLKVGKPIAKKKKLHPISAVIDNNVPTQDQDVWKALLQKEFSHKWRAGNPHKKSVLNDTLASVHGIALQGTYIDFLTAAEQLGNQNVIDSMGLCPSLFWPHPRKPRTPSTT